MRKDPLGAIFAALADPTRRAILLRLAQGEASVGALAAPFAMSLPAVSRHLNVLERAGLVRRGRDAQWRPCTLERQPLTAAGAWLEAAMGGEDADAVLDMRAVLGTRGRGTAPSE